MKLVTYLDGHLRVGAVDGGRVADLSARFDSMQSLIGEGLPALEEARFPVLAAIQGGCIGGAVDMVSACDLRYSTG